VKNPTEDLCLPAATPRGTPAGFTPGILFKHEPTTEPTCAAAVRPDGLTLYHIPREFQDKYDICLLAVKQNPLALKFARNQTEDMCLSAVSVDGCALEFVLEQTPRICIAAIKQTNDAVVFVKNKTPEILKSLVR